MGETPMLPADFPRIRKKLLTTDTLPIQAFKILFHQDFQASFARLLARMQPHLLALRPLPRHGRRHLQAKLITGKTCARLGDLLIDFQAIRKLHPRSNPRDFSGLAGLYESLYIGRRKPKTDGIAVKSEFHKCMGFIISIC